MRTKGNIFDDEERKKRKKASIKRRLLFAGGSIMFLGLAIFAKTCSKNTNISKQVKTATPVVRQVENNEKTDDMIKESSFEYLAEEKNDQAQEFTADDRAAIEARLEANGLLDEEAKNKIVEICNDAEEKGTSVGEAKEEVAEVFAEVVVEDENIKDEVIEEAEDVIEYAVDNLDGGKQLIENMEENGASQEEVQELKNNIVETTVQSINNGSYENAKLDQRNDIMELFGLPKSSKSMSKILFSENKSFKESADFSITEKNMKLSYLNKILPSAKEASKNNLDLYNSVYRNFDQLDKESQINLADPDTGITVKSVKPFEFQFGADASWKQATGQVYLSLNSALVVNGKDGAPSGCVFAGASVAVNQQNNNFGGVVVGGSLKINKEASAYGAVTYDLITGAQVKAGVTITFGGESELKTISAPTNAKAEEKVINNKGDGNGKDKPDSPTHNPNDPEPTPEHGSDDLGPSIRPDGMDGGNTGGATSDDLGPATTRTNTTSNNPTTGGFGGDLSSDETRGYHT